MLRAGRSKNLPGEARGLYFESRVSAFDLNSRLEAPNEKTAQAHSAACQNLNEKQ
jgi:hypothetical protein